MGTRKSRFNFFEQTIGNTGVGWGSRCQHLRIIVFLTKKSVNILAVDSLDSALLLVVDIFSELLFSRL